MHYENYRWQDHAPDPDRRRVDLALMIAFVLVFSIGGLESLTGGHGVPQSGSPPAFQATLDTLQVADDGAAAHTACRG